MHTLETLPSGREHKSKAMEYGVHASEGSPWLERQAVSRAMCRAVCHSGPHKGLTGTRGSGGGRREEGMRASQ